MNTPCPECLDEKWVDRVEVEDLDHPLAKIITNRVRCAACTPEWARLDTSNVEFPKLDMGMIESGETGAFMGGKHSAENDEINPHGSPLARMLGPVYMYEEITKEIALNIEWADTQLMGELQ